MYVCVYIYICICIYIYIRTKGGLVKGDLAIGHVYNFHVNLVYYNCTGETQPNVLHLHKGNA